MADVEEQDGRNGLSRRQMIKASAVAGAAAWSAPVIIDSLSSPAAAGSCICDTPPGNYRGVKIENLSSCSGTKTGSSGFTGNNSCAAGQWASVNPTLTLLGTTAPFPTFDCATFTVNLPSGCTFGSKGVIGVFGGQTGCTYNFFVQNPVPAGYGAQQPGAAGALSEDGSSFQLPVAARVSLSHVNIVYCCC
jgi:hypothetical protein